MKAWKDRIRRRPWLKKIVYPLYDRFGRKLLNIPWMVNLHRIELEITTACTLACFHCDRAVRQAPTTDRMSVGQVRKFVDESLALAWRWERILVLGGEPTLHPQLPEILVELSRYRDARPECVVELVTNGYGESAARAIEGLPPWVLVRNSRKTSNEQSFATVNVAPRDLDAFRGADFSKGCLVTEDCGLGLSRHGYYPCGAGAAVDRVFGFDVGIRSLAGVNTREMRERMRTLCALCGYFKGEKACARAVREEYSPSWAAALARYRTNPPRLSVY